MARKNRTYLKGKFETGDIPTEQDYIDFLDSYDNLSEDTEPNTWYVKTSGSDSNVGSDKLPFKTIQVAIDEAVSGDNIYLSTDIFSEDLTTNKILNFIGTINSNNEFSASTVIIGTHTFSNSSGLTFRNIGLSNTTIISTTDLRIGLYNSRLTITAISAGKIKLYATDSNIPLLDSVKLHSLFAINCTIKESVVLTVGNDVSLLGGTSCEPQLIAGVDGACDVILKNSTVNAAVTVTGNLTKYNSVITGTETVSGTTTDEVQDDTTKLSKTDTAAQTINSNIAVVGKTNTFSATPTFDFDDGGNVQKLVVTGDLESISISNELPSGIYTVFLNQDGTGGHSIPLPDASFGTITRISVAGYSPNPNAINSINIQVDPDGNKTYWLNSTGIAWYVRPLGGSYGLENGSNYDNAWDGFTGIDWASLKVGDTLIVAGTHTQLLNVAVSGITIRGDYVGDLGIIDGELTLNCITISDKVNVTLTEINCINALSSGIGITGNSTGIITNDVTVSASGNQAIQCEGTSESIHNNPTCTGNVDDGISGHGSATFVVNNGTISNNKDGINWVESVIATINGTTFSGQSAFDVKCNAVTGSGVVNNVDFDGSLTLLDGELELNNCTNVDLTSLSGDFTANDTVFIGTVAPPLVASVITLHSCIIPAMSFVNNGDYYIDECNFLSLAVSAGGMDLRIDKSIINVGANHGIDVKFAGGSTTITNSVFKGMNGKYGVVTAAVADNVIINGNTFDGGGVGRGYFNSLTMSINNNIFVDCLSGINGAAGTLTANNCCFFNNTADTLGTVTLVNEVTGDPNFVDAVNDDYSLDTGSSCIATGLDIGATYEDGIDTANWGDASTAPIITTKTQGVNWDIGSYVS